MQTQDIYWQALGVPGLEASGDQGISDRGLEADGFVIRNHSGSPLRLRYALRYDTEWNPLEFRADSQLDGTHLHIFADGDHWLDERQHELPAVRGCTDIDIMATPFTNTPAIRRPGLRPGESRDIDALFVRIPTLTLKCIVSATPVLTLVPPAVVTATRTWRVALRRSSRLMPPSW